MGESIDREVSAIDGQDPIDARVVVHDGKHDRIDEGERLIDILRQYVAGLTIRTPTRRPHLKEVSGLVYQPEDAQRNARVFPRTDSSVVPELGICLADNDIGDSNLRTSLPCFEDVARCPSMVAVPTIDCRDKQTAVSERGQRRIPSYRPLRKGPLVPR